MVKKLTKHGNSLALVIDRPIPDPHRIDPETPLDISTDGRQLIVAPAKPSARRKKFDVAQEWARKRYGKAFRKLAEPKQSTCDSALRLGRLETLSRTARAARAALAKDADAGHKALRKPRSPTSPAWLSSAPTARSVIEGPQKPCGIERKRLRHL